MTIQKWQRCIWGGVLRRSSSLQVQRQTTVAAAGWRVLPRRWRPTKTLCQPVLERAAVIPAQSRQLTLYQNPHLSRLRHNDCAASAWQPRSAEVGCYAQNYTCAQGDDRDLHSLWRTTTNRVMTILDTVQSLKQASDLDPNNVWACANLLDSHLMQVGPPGRKTCTCLGNRLVSGHQHLQATR